MFKKAGQPKAVEFISSQETGSPHDSSKAGLRNERASFRCPTQEATNKYRQQIDELRGAPLGSVGIALARLSDAQQMDNPKHRREQLQALRDSIAQAGLDDEVKKNVQYLAASSLASGFPEISAETDLKEYCANFIQYFQKNVRDDFVKLLGGQLQRAVAEDDASTRLKQLGEVLKEWLADEENKNSAKYLPVLALQQKMAEFTGRQLPSLSLAQRKPSLDQYASPRLRADTISGMGETIKASIDSDPKQGVLALLDNLAVLSLSKDRSDLLAAVAEKHAEVVYAVLKEGLSLAPPDQFVSPEQFQKFVHSDSKGVFAKQFADDPDFPQRVVNQLVETGVSGGAAEVGRMDTGGSAMAPRFYAVSGLAAFQAAFREQVAREEGDDLQKYVNALCKMALPASWKTMIQETLQGMAAYPDQLLHDPNATEEQKVLAQKIAAEMPVRQANMFVNLLATRLIGKLPESVLVEHASAQKVGQGLIRAVAETSKADPQHAERIGTWLEAQTGYRARNFNVGELIVSPRTPRTESSELSTPRSEGEPLPFFAEPVPPHVQQQLSSFSLQSLPSSSPKPAE